MKLIEAHVTNFRSAEDSEAFKVEQVTCLVGKNEAGKSAILLALAALQPHPSTPVIFDRERDYPRRHLTAYAQRHKGQEAVAISTKWKLTDDELEDVRKVIGDKALKSSVIEISRKYSKEPLWKFDIDVKKAVSHLLSERGFNNEQLAGLKNAEDISDLFNISCKEISGLIWKWCTGRNRPVLWLGIIDGELRETHVSTPPRDPVLYSRSYSHFGEKARVAMRQMSTEKSQKWLSRSGF